MLLGEVVNPHIWEPQIQAKNERLWSNITTSRNTESVPTSFWQALKTDHFEAIIR